MALPPRTHSPAQIAAWTPWAPAADTRFKISNFPQDGRPWQVVLHGQIAAPSIVDEALCQVVLAPADWDTPRSEARQPVGARTVSLGLGQLAIAPVGSIWIDGISCDHVGRRRKATVISASNWPGERLGVTVPFKHAGTANWQAAYPTGAADDMPLFRVETDDGRALRISPLELARATFAPSSEWLRLMVEGGVDIWPTLRRRIVDRKKSGRDPDDPRLLNVRAHRALDEHDVLAAARIVADRTLMTSFLQVFASLQRQNHNLRPAHVRMPFPFSRPSVWTFEESWITTLRKDGTPLRRRLITHIHAIEYDLGLDRVNVYHPRRDQGRVPDESNEDPVQIAVAGSKTIERQLNLMTGVASWSALGQLAAPGMGTQVSCGWKIEHIGLSSEAHGRVDVHGVPLEDAVAEAVTADGGSKAERAGRQAIKVVFRDPIVAKLDVPRPPLPRVAWTLEVLKRLVSQAGGELEIIAPANGPGAEDHDGLWRYPLQQDDRKLTWSRTREGRPRRALVARIATARGSAYVFEAEHLERPGTEDHPEDQDGYTALALMYVAGRRPLSAGEVLDLLTVQAVHRGVWLPLEIAFPLLRLRRCSAWRTDAAGYIKALSRMLARFDGADP